MHISPTQIGLTRLPVSREGVEMHPEMVQAVLEWEVPCARRQLQSFLGFMNFYRQFIPTQIALPLTSLVKTKGEGKAKSGNHLKWSMESWVAFEKLDTIRH